MSALAGVIQGAHMTLAWASGQPHWLINEADAKQFSAAWQNVARWHSIKASQKAIDHLALAIVLFNIETPRIIMSAQLAKRPPQPQRPPAQVFRFVNPNAPAPPATSSSSPPLNEGAGAPVAEGPPDASSDMGAIGGEPAA